jgi:hypothetical protein
VRDQAQTIINQVFDALDSGTPTSLALSLDLRPIKVALGGESGTAFANALTAELPACESGQSARPPNALLPQCVPSEASPESLAASVIERLPEIIEQIPDEFVFDENVVFNPAVSSSPFNDTPVSDVMRGAVIATVSLAALFWVITALIGSRSTRGVFVGLGAMLFIVAGLVFASGFGLITALIGPYMRDAIMRTDLSLGTQEALESVIEVVGGQIGGSFLLTGGIALAVALGLFLLGIFSPRSERDDHSRTVTVGVN